MQRPSDQNSPGKWIQKVNNTKFNTITIIVSFSSYIVRVATLRGSCSNSIAIFIQCIYYLCTVLTPAPFRQFKPWFIFVTTIGKFKRRYLKFFRSRKILREIRVRSANKTDNSINEITLIGNFHLAISIP